MMRWKASLVADPGTELPRRALREAKCQIQKTGALHASSGHQCQLVVVRGEDDVQQIVLGL